MVFKLGLMACFCSSLCGLQVAAGNTETLQPQCVTYSNHILCSSPVKLHCASASVRLMQLLDLVLVSSIDIVIDMRTVLAFELVCCSCDTCWSTSILVLLLLLRLLLATGAIRTFLLVGQKRGSGGSRRRESWCVPSQISTGLRRRPLPKPFSGGSPFGR